MNEVVLLQGLSDFLYRRHQKLGAKGRLNQYLEETDYYSATSDLAGFSSQIKSYGKIVNIGNLLFYRDYKFIDSELCDKYFVKVDGLEYFISHLEIEQRKLEICISIAKT